MNNDFSNLFDCIRGELSKTSSCVEKDELIPFFNSSKRLKIMYNDTNVFFFSAKSKDEKGKCRIADRVHKSNSMGTIISQGSLNVYQKCTDGDCENHNNGVQFICSLKDLLSTLLIEDLNKEIAKIYMDNTIKLEVYQEKKFTDLHNKISKNFI